MGDQRRGLLSVTASVTTPPLAADAGEVADVLDRQTDRTSERGTCDTPPGAPDDPVTHPVSQVGVSHPHARRPLARCDTRLRATKGTREVWNEVAKAVGRDQKWTVDQAGRRLLQAVRIMQRRGDTPEQIRTYLFGKERL